MLKKIRCEKFRKKELFFHKGLNTIVGDDLGKNSLGKTSLLMIIDFIFGGKDYITVNSDTVEQLGHHEFLFSFEFNNKSYNFIRNTEIPDEVVFCDNNFQKIESKKVGEYCCWLQNKYHCELEGLSFRNIVGRYFRIYGKQNLDEKNPIKYVNAESEEIQIINLIKLFEKYIQLKVLDEKLSELDKNKKAFNTAKNANLISVTANKTEYKKNQDEIDEMKKEIKSLEKQTTNIKALITKDVLALQEEQGKFIIVKNKLVNRKKRVKLNNETSKSKTKDELDKLIQYFPEFNKEKIEEIDNFHEKIKKILKKELKESESEINEEISNYEIFIEEINEKIRNILQINDKSMNSAIKTSKIIELTSKINYLQERNDNYDKNSNVKANITADKESYKTLKTKVTDDISGQINELLNKFIEKIYSDGRRSPNLNIHDNKYSFSTAGDTGTGTAYSSLISFDLILLKLTHLPTIIHDLPLFKNIEKPAQEKIFKKYSECEKQIFIAIDEVTTYNKESQQIIQNSKVLQLTNDELLFIKDWRNSD